MIFDTHAHYENEKFDTDREQLLASMHTQGIGCIVNVGSSLDTSRQSMHLAQQYDFIYAAVGVHPSEISCLDETGIDWLRQQAAHPKVVAIGEIGLDYYWEKDLSVRKKQREWFERQLAVAQETGLPVIIHSRDAAQDTLAIMKEAGSRKIPGVIHCFSYAPEQAEQYVQMGYYIGVGGVVTFANAKKLAETVKLIPLESLVLETDCPYLAPEPHRGKRNSSLYLPYVAEKIAEIKGIPAAEVIRVTEQNACQLYRI